MKKPKGINYGVKHLQRFVFCCLMLRFEIVLIFENQFVIFFNYNIFS